VCCLGVLPVRIWWPPGMVDSSSGPRLTVACGKLCLHLQTSWATLRLLHPCCSMKVWLLQLTLKARPATGCKFKTLS